MHRSLWTLGANFTFPPFFIGKSSDANSYTNSICSNNLTPRKWARFTGNVVCSLLIELVRLLILKYIEPRNGYGSIQVARLSFWTHQKESQRVIGEKLKLKGLIKNGWKESEYLKGRENTWLYIYFDPSIKDRMPFFQKASEKIIVKFIREWLKWKSE